MCSKRPYRTSEEASAVRDRIYQRSGAVKRSYVCDGPGGCGKNHLTSHVSEKFEREFRMKHERNAK